jgi:hypothetical protein
VIFSFFPWSKRFILTNRAKNGRSPRANQTI